MDAEAPRPQPSFSCWSKHAPALIQTGHSWSPQGRSLAVLSPLQTHRCSPTRAAPYGATRALHCRPLLIHTGSADLSFTSQKSLYLAHPRSLHLLALPTQGSIGLCSDPSSCTQTPNMHEHTDQTALSQDRIKITFNQNSTSTGSVCHLHKLPDVCSLMPLLSLPPDTDAGENPAQSPKCHPDDSWHLVASRCVWCGSGTCGGQRAVGKEQRQGPACHPPLWNFAGRIGLDMARHGMLPASVPLGEPSELGRPSLGWLSARGYTWAVLQCISEAQGTLCISSGLCRNLCGENKITPLYATGW